VPIMRAAVTASPFIHHHPNVFSATCPRFDPMFVRPPIEERPKGKQESFAGCVKGDTVHPFPCPQRAALQPLRVPMSHSARPAVGSSYNSLTPTLRRYRSDRTPLIGQVDQFQRVMPHPS
jgi:hypothetical protein